MKTCSKCKVTKPISEFGRESKKPDGLRGHCKACAYSMTINWNRSKKGVAVRMWHKHNTRSVERGHQAPDYDRDWLISFIVSHPDYNDLHEKYEKSCFDKYLAPSIDRIDDNLGYRKDNIRLVSFQDNMDHCYDAGRKAEHYNSGWDKGCMRSHHAVVQLTLKGDFVARYISVNEAARQTRGDNSKIPMCCQGKRKSHAGFQFVYAEDYDKIGYKAQDISKSHVPQKRKVLQMTLAGTYVGEYESASLAARENGFVASGISACANGKLKSYKGYSWKYV